MNNDDYAIVAGISTYPAFKDLQGPENDACRFRDWLLSPGGGNIDPHDPARITLILSSEQFDPQDDPLRAKPTLAELEYAFDRLIERGEAADDYLGRRLYIYLAGHGFGPDVEEAALLMANASRRRMYHIPGRSYARWFRMAAIFQEIVLFMDCCRDDYPRVPLHVPPWPEIRRPDGADVDYFYGFATKWSRKAREKVIESGGPVQGLFTHALLHALEHAPADDEGRVTGAAVESYIFNYLPDLVAESEYQEPRFEYDRMHDLVLVERPRAEPVEESPGGRGTPVQVRFGAAVVRRTVEILQHNFQPVATTIAGSDLWHLRLKPGIYRLRVPGTTHETVFDVIGQEVIHVALG